jgi:outer membrane biogenesis lipoprotein LolB
MTAVFHRFRLNMQLLALVLLCACGSELQSQEPTVTKSDQLIQQAKTVVDSYVRNSKQWQRNDFQIEFNRKEGAALVFWVLHSDDKTAKSPGGGKSIEVYVDPVKREVFKELAFQ